MNPEDEFIARERQRITFLCEVYKWVGSDISKAFPYEQITKSLNFPKDAIEQACLYLEREGYIDIHSSPRFEIIPPKGRTVGKLPSIHDKFISLTDRGICCARQVYHSSLNGSE